MSVESSQVTVGLTPAILAFNTDSGNPVEVVLKNAGGTTNIYLGGGTTVASTTGFLWGTADQPFKTKLGTGEVLYGVASGGTTNIHVLKQDVG